MDSSVYCAMCCKKFTTPYSKRRHNKRRHQFKKSWEEVDPDTLVEKLTAALADKRERKWTTHATKHKGVILYYFTV